MRGRGRGQKGDHGGPEGPGIEFGGDSGRSQGGRLFTNFFRNLMFLTHQGSNMKMHRVGAPIQPLGL